MRRKKTMPEKAVIEPIEELMEPFQQTSQLMMKSILTVQEHNMKFVQSTFTNAMEVLKSHVEVMNALLQQMGEQTQRQQEIWQKFAPGWTANQWMEIYTDTYKKLFGEVFSSYQQALEVAETSAFEEKPVLQKKTHSEGGVAIAGKRAP
jgi:hypothetical protein